MDVIITGGAGFIGSNAAARHLGRGNSVVILDNLSRRGAQSNLDWLAAQGGDLHVEQVDIRDAEAIARAFDAHAEAEAVLHLAGQVAVTTSVHDPREDFEINALGTFNVLEAARRLPRLRALLFASTNKVYGGMEDVGVVEQGGRYAYAYLPGRRQRDPAPGLPLALRVLQRGRGPVHLDYARIYGLPTVTLRQSCIYGPAS